MRLPFLLALGGLCLAQDGAGALKLYPDGALEPEETPEVRELHEAAVEASGRSEVEEKNNKEEDGEQRQDVLPGEGTQPLDEGATEAPATEAPPVIMPEPVIVPVFIPRPRRLQFRPNPSFRAKTAAKAKTKSQKK